MGLWCLPAETRFYIWKLVLDDIRPGTTPIRLAPVWLYTGSWDDDSLTSLKDVLLVLDKFRDVCFDMYAELRLTCLMTEYHYVCLSPFGRTCNSNKLAMNWIPKYGKYMRRMILELDMSRFSFGPHVKEPDIAGSLANSSGTLGMQVLISMFVDNQLQRKHRTNKKKDLRIESLFLLCRRYYGLRPGTVNEPGSSTAAQPVRIPFCSDEALRICDPLIKLSGLIDTIRICGFSTQYSHFLIRQLFELASDHGFVKDANFKTAKGGPWPRMPGRSSYIDVNYRMPNPLIVLDNHSGPMPLADHERPPISAFDDMDADSIVAGPTVLEKALKKAKSLFPINQLSVSPGPRSGGTRYFSADATLKPSKAIARHETTERRTASLLPHIKRSLSIGQKSHTSSLEPALDRVSSRITLKKKISNFSLRGKASKKSLREGSSDQDSTTLIPADNTIPPVPALPPHFKEVYSAAKPLKDELTEQSNVHGLKVKASKAELTGLLKENGQSDQSDTAEQTSTADLAGATSSPSPPKEEEVKTRKTSFTRNVLRKMSFGNLRQKPSGDPGPVISRPLPTSRTALPTPLNRSLPGLPPIPPAFVQEQKANATERVTQTSQLPGPVLGTKALGSSLPQNSRLLGVQPRDNSTPATSLSPVIHRYGGSPRLGEQSTSQRSLASTARPTVPERAGSKTPVVRQQPSEASMRGNYGTGRGQLTAPRPTFTGSLTSRTNNRYAFESPSPSPNQSEEKKAKAGSAQKPVSSASPVARQAQYTRIAAQQADLRRGTSTSSNNRKYTSPYARALGHSNMTARYGSSSPVSPIEMPNAAAQTSSSRLPKSSPTVTPPVQSLRTPRVPVPANINRSGTPQTSSQYSGRSQLARAPARLSPHDRLRAENASPQPLNIRMPGTKTSQRNLRSPNLHTPNARLQNRGEAQARNTPSHQPTVGELRITKTRTPTTADERASPPLPGAIHEASSFLSIDNPFLSSPKKNPQTSAADQLRQPAPRTVQSSQDLHTSARSSAATSQTSLRPGPGGRRLFERQLLASSESATVQGSSIPRPGLSTQAPMPSVRQPTTRNRTFFSFDEDEEDFF